MMKTAGKLAIITLFILLGGKAMGWLLGLLPYDVAFSLLNVLLAIGGAALVLLLVRHREGK